MNLFEKQYQEVIELIGFEDYNQATKRIIDFTLDTEDIVFYKKTNDFLNWNDTNSDSEEVKKRLNDLASSLHGFLIKKEIKPHQTIISIEKLGKNTIPILH